MLAKFLQKPLLQTTVGLPLLGHWGEGLVGQKERGSFRKHDIPPKVKKQSVYLIYLCDADLESGNVQILPERQAQHV